LGAPFAPFGVPFAPLGAAADGAGAFAFGAGEGDTLGPALAFGPPFIFGLGDGGIGIEGGQAQVAAELGGEVPVPVRLVGAGGGIGGIADMGAPGNCQTHVQPLLLWEKSQSVSS
jgi:hypothetical protein